MSKSGYPKTLPALKLTALGHTFTKSSKGGYVFIAILALLLVSGEVYGTWRALQFLNTFGDLGTNVFARVLEIGLIVLTSSVTFSATTTAIQTLYLSDDLNFLLAQPIHTVRVFSMKVFETYLNTALLPTLLTLPIIITIGTFFEAPLWAYPLMMVAMLLAFAAPVGLGALLAVGLMRVAPAGKVRDVSTALGVVISAALVYAIRAMRPEVILKQAQDPAKFEELLKSFTSPSNPFLPPSWAAQSIWQSANGLWSWSLLPLLLLAIILLVTAVVLATFAYQEGWARALDSSTPKLDPTPRRASWAERLFARFGPAASLAYKDLRVTLREPTQWSQLLVVVALAAVYLVSVQAVPMPVPQFRGILGYIQLAFQGFIIAGVAVRLAFPAVSMEARGYWLLRTGPLTSRQVVLSKFWGILPITLILGLVMSITSANSLNLGPALVIMSVLISISNAFVITALGVGLGAAEPKFTADNPAELGLSTGGLIFMGLSLGYSVICLLLLARAAAGSVLRPELFPGYTSLTTIEGLVGLMALLLLTTVGTWLALRHGWRGLEKQE